MKNEHNPIAQLVSNIQNKWINDVSSNDDLQLIRWLIVPDQSKLYEGFLRVESSSYGIIPDVPVVLLTPFESAKKHSQNLIKDWLENYEKEQEQLQKGLEESNLEFQWNYNLYKSRLESSEDDTMDILLLEMLQSFQMALPDPQVHLCLSLFPYSVDDTKEYEKWLIKLVSNTIPEKVRIQFFDYVDNRGFDKLMNMYSSISKSLNIPLDLDRAIEKIASSGDSNDPEVQFRKCMIEMSKSVSKKNEERLHKWGERGLEITLKTGSKAAFASAHTIYAGMLFSFKQFDKIDELLNAGLRIAKHGLQINDKNCETIIIQNYGFRASSLQFQKEEEKACELFCKQAELAIEYNIGVQALSAWWLAYQVIKKKDSDKYKSIINKAYDHGTTLDTDILKVSCFNHIAADYYLISEKNKKYDQCESIDGFMTKVEGIHWRENVEGQRKEMQKKKLSIFNWF